MSENADNTAPKPKRVVGRPFEAGKPSANPLGRPKGSRNALGEAFIAAMYEDFQKNGIAVIEQVRAEKPDQYLKVISNILPKELHIKEETIDGLSDNELVDILNTVRSFSAQHRADTAGAGAKAQKREKAPRSELN